MTPSDHLLANTLSPSSLNELRQCLTRMWSPATREAASERALNDVAFQRHDNTVQHGVPWIHRHLDLSATTIIDFGCGCGSSSLALSHFAKRVVGLEIDPGYASAFNDRMRICRASNCECILTTSDSIVKVLEEIYKPGTSILFLAVLEHLTEREQLDYLRKAWMLLEPGQFLIILETPNRLSLFDDHTFETSFAHIIPDELFPEWIRAQPVGTRFRDLLVSVADVSLRDVLLRRRRLGVGVAPQLFELALQEPLDDIIVADAWDDYIRAWFPPTKCDELLLEYWINFKPSLPIGFSRSVLCFIFRKPKGVDCREASRAWSVENTARVVDSYTAQANCQISGLRTACDAAERLALERWEIMNRMELMIRERDAVVAAQGRMLEERWNWIQALESRLRNMHDTNE